MFFAIFFFYLYFFLYIENNNNYLIRLLLQFNLTDLMVIIVITDNALDSTSKFGYGCEFSL